jgi:hypothetical protein
LAEDVFDRADLMRMMQVGGDSNRQIDGVTIIGDFLRPEPCGNPGGIDRTAAWLFNAVKRQIVQASGLPVHQLTPTASPELAAWLVASRAPAEAEAVWARCYADLSQRPDWEAAIDRLVLQKLHRHFCVGYELPPYLVRLLDRHAIPYLDIRIHPVRFLDDLLFAVRASHGDTQGLLADLAVHETEVIITAGLREAACRLISNGAMPANTVIVLGQRQYDSSQIIDGKFFDAMDHRANIAAIGARHNAVILKPHPLERDHSLLVVAAGVCRNILGVVNDNLYKLLSMPEVGAILTVSSSAAYEAPYFGKTVIALAELPIRLGWRGSVARADIHLSLNDIVLSVDFWRMALSPYVATSEPDGIRLPPKPNRLRIALDSFWNFNEIDTDRLPVRAA